MTNLFQFSEPTKTYCFDCLQAMDLVFKIDAALAGNQNCIALGLKNCIANKVPASKIIKEIKMMINDNFNAMADMLGGVLTVTIQNFK